MYIDHYLAVKTRTDGDSLVSKVVKIIVLSSVAKSRRSWQNTAETFLQEIQTEKKVTGCGNENFRYVGMRVRCVHCFGF